MLFPLLGVGAQVSLQFGTVETLKKVIQSKFGEADGSLHWKYSVMCGVISGIPSAIAVVRSHLYIDTPRSLKIQSRAAERRTRVSKNSHPDLQATRIQEVVPGLQ